MFFQEAGTEADEQILTKVFKEFGKVIQFKLIRDKNGQSLGRGFVRFSNRMSACLAVKGLNKKKILEGANRPMNVKFAEEHGKKKTSVFDRLG